MSVTTTADEHLRDAKDDIKSAVKHLHVVLDPETWGSEEYNKEYRDKMIEIYKQLLDIRDEL